jgi:hypothetical protein
MDRAEFSDISEPEDLGEGPSSSMRDTRSKKRRKKWNGRTFSEERSFRSQVKAGVRRCKEQAEIQNQLSTMVRRALDINHPETEIPAGGRMILLEHHLSERAPAVKHVVALGVVSKVRMLKMNSLSGWTPGTPIVLFKELMQMMLDAIAADLGYVF